jgi:hypothetical protein
MQGLSDTEREGDEEINDDESDDTINGPITGWLNP